MSTERFLDENDLAEKLHNSRRTLQGWRLRGVGPRWIKVESSVRYSPEDVQDWIEAQRRSSTSDPGSEPRPAA